ncbi:uncharacterized protein BO72DRAFT_520786, partial [Aspergillus fijiensis CBS 313.89]
LTAPSSRLDKSCIFLPTSHFTGSMPSATGKFFLSLPEAIWAKTIKVRLVGRLKIKRNNEMITEDRELITYKEEQGLVSSKTHSSFQIPAGKYEFLFDIPIPSDLFETSVGPDHNYHTYQIEAIVERRVWRDIVVSQVLSIYKLPEVELCPLSAESPLTIGGESAQNIEYCISIPSPTIPFGSIFSVDMGFQAPSKDVDLSALTLEVIESHHIRLNATAAQAALNILSVSASRTHSLFKETQSPVGGSGSVSCTGTEWAVSSRVALPRSVSLCSQSVRTKMVTIDHAFEVRAEFRDRNGRLFDTIAISIPFSIYMTPRVIGPDGSICEKVLEYGTCPPPPYERHTSHARLLDPSEVMDDSGQCTLSVADRILDGQVQHQSQLLGLAAPCYELATGCDPPVYALC